MKKFVLALLAVVLVMGLCTVAYAWPGYPTPDHGHTCESEDYYYVYYFEGKECNPDDLPCEAVYTFEKHCVCGELLKKGTETVKHDWSLKVHAATCEDQGEKYYYCSRCKGQTDIEIIPAHGHAPLNDDWDIKMPTCTENGYKKYVCKYCNETQTEILEKHEHVYQKNFEDVRDADKKAPTCTEDGYAIFRCMCGLCDCTEDKLVVYPKKDHKYDNGKTAWYLHAVTAAPTCTEDGVGVEKCDLCKAERPCVVDALTHAWTEYTVIIEPLCEADGYKTRICTRPGCKDGRNGKAAEEVVVLPALGHDEVSKVTKAPTCEDVGSQTITCKRCAKVWTEEIPANGHTLGEWTVTECFKTANCTVPGCKYYEVVSFNCPADPETPVVPDKPAGDDDDNESEGGSSSTGSGSDASIPATGDNTSNVPYIMMVAAVAGLVVLVASKRKVNC